jgi:hypothetical protein
VVVWLFFISYAFMSSFVLINLFVMIIADNFEQGEEEKKDGPTEAANHLVDSFVAAWKTLDPYATQYLESTQLMALFTMMTAPSGGHTLKLPNLTLDEDDKLTVEMAAAFERKLKLHYWRTPSGTPQATGVEDADLETGGAKQEDTSWVHFSEVLARLHAVSFDDLCNELPPRALARLPSRNLAQRIETDTRRRSLRLAKSAKSSTPRLAKLDRLAMISAIKSPARP